MIDSLTVATDFVHVRDPLDWQLALGIISNIGAIITRIGFGGIFYCT